MATSRFPVRIVGADREARKMATAASLLVEDLHQAKRDLGTKSELVFAAHALHETGRMARGVVAHDFGDILVDVHARNPLTGFDYVGVTRFGHSVARITAKGPGHALRLPFDGGIFRRSVRGFHPGVDWAETALPQIYAQADQVAQALGRKVASRL